MIALRLVRLIEAHSDELAHGLIRKFESCRKCEELRNVPRQELENRAREIYHNLGEWLLSKTESDIEDNYTAIARRRADQGVSLSAVLWALILTQDHLWEFIHEEGFANSGIGLHAGFELMQLTNQFFERAMYYVAKEYELILRAQQVALHI